MSIGAGIDKIFFIITAFLSNMLLMYFITWFSSKASIKICEIGDIAYDTEWYMFPKLSKMYVLLLIQNTQCPYYLNGFKLIHCNLETFGRVSITISAMYECMNIKC